MDEIERTFLEAIGKNPDDEEARAVYADWLEQRGDPRGEYLRLESQLHQIPRRLAELATGIDPGWIDAIRRRYTVVLVETGPNKIMVIKEVRECTGLGLKDAKDAVEGASFERPFTLAVEVDHAQAESLVARFAAAGARTKIVPDLASVTQSRDVDVVLTAVRSDRKIYAIKAVRELTGLGLKEAKDLVEAVAAGNGRTILRSASREEAERAVALFRDTGDVSITAPLF